MSKILVSIIAPLFTADDSIYQMTVNMFLSSLQRSTFKAHTEVILIDDKSPYNSIIWPEILKNFADLNIKLLRNKVNKGFVRSTIRGIKASAGKYIIMSNTDILAGESVVERLYRILETDKSIAAIGPQLSNASGYSSQEHRIDCKLKNYAPPQIEQIRNLVEGLNIKNGKQSKLREVDYLVGAFLMFSRNDYENVRGLDKNYGIGYHEEIDLIVKFRKKLQKKVCVALDCFVFHGSVEGESPSMNRIIFTKIGQFFKNFIYFIRKHGIWERVEIVKARFLGKMIDKERILKIRQKD